MRRGLSGKSKNSVIFSPFASYVFTAEGFLQEDIIDYDAYKLKPNKMQEEFICSVQDLREREIINLKDGARLGSVCDVEIDTLSGSIVSIVIYGKGRFPFKSGKPKDIKIKWDEIEVIGDDTILVNFDCPEELMPQKPKNPIDTLFRL